MWPIYCGQLPLDRLEPELWVHWRTSVVSVVVISYPPALKVQCVASAAESQAAGGGWQGLGGLAGGEGWALPPEPLYEKPCPSGQSADTCAGPGPTQPNPSLY